MTTHDDPYLDVVTAYYAELERLSDIGLLGRTEPAEIEAVRAAVDAGRAPLLARITELEAERAGGQWFTEYVVVKNGEVNMQLGAYDSLTEATEDVHLYPGEHVTTRRVWYGPVTPAEPAAPDGPR
jgi:hypothetical protein